MGVYIKGMNIDEDHACIRCRLSTKTAFDNPAFCDVTMKDIPDWNKRPDWCPLVPVPPHGRLIDGDYAEKDLAHDYAYAAAQMVKHYPTIIPAEEGKS